MLSVRGTFRDGVALPTEAIEEVEGVEVIITFLDRVGEPTGQAGPGSKPDSPAELELERVVREIRDARSIAENKSVEDRPIRQRQDLLKMIEALSALPAIVQQDGLFNRDHDRILDGSNRDLGRHRGVVGRVRLHGRGSRSRCGLACR